MIAYIWFYIACSQISKPSRVGLLRQIWSNLTINSPASRGGPTRERWDQYVSARHIYRIVLKSAIFNDFYENVWGCKYTFHIENACGLTLDSFFYNISKQNNNIDWKMSKTRKQFKKIQNSDWINSTNHEMKQ